MQIITKQQFNNTKRKSVIKNPIFKALYELSVGYGIKIDSSEWNDKKWQKPYSAVADFGLRHDMKFTVKKIDDDYLILRTK